MAKVAQVEPAYPVGEALKVACAAYRINGGMRKQVTDANGNSSPTNADLVKGYFSGSPIVVTDADRIAAENCADLIGSHMTHRLLLGQKVNQFMADVAKLLAQETIAKYQVGMFVFAPKLADDLRKRDELSEKFIESAQQHEPLAPVGCKVELEFTMLKHHFVQTLNCFSVSGHDGKGHVIQFLTAHQSLCKSGRIKAKVRGFKEDPFNNHLPTTQLNFVKEVT